MNPLLLLLLGLGGFMTTFRSTSSSDAEEAVEAAAQNDDDDDQPASDDAPAEETSQEDATTLALTWVIYDMAVMRIVDTIDPGETVDLGTVLTDDFTIAVETSGPDVGSLSLEYDGQTWLQNDYPYTLKPDWVDLSEGDFEVAVTVYSGANTTGTILGTDTITFSTTSQAPELVVEEEEVNVDETVEDPVDEPAEEPVEAPAEDTPAEEKPADPA